MNWGWLLLPVALLALLAYWQLVIAEGTYLGPKVVALLYDWSARGYDKLKGFSSAEEDWFLGRPLTMALSAYGRPLVLDVSTGTGRLPRTLLRQPRFAGNVIGLDLSAGMLRVADERLTSYDCRIDLLMGLAAPLPFADDQFEAVTCLEALEFFTDARSALDEMVRVLRPGGWLLVTNRVGWEARLMPGRTWSRAEFVSVLRELPITDISVRIWQTCYDLAWARKRTV
jgi:ubiquinone/menaquinone biosynthesis C-methylase UbiE